MDVQQLDLTEAHVRFLEHDLGLKLSIDEAKVLRLAYACVVPGSTSVKPNAVCKCGAHKQGSVFNLIPTFAAQGIFVIVYTNKRLPFAKYEGLAVLVPPPAKRKKPRS